MKYKLACSLFISSRCERELYCCYSLFTRAPSYLPHVCTISVTLREPRTCRYDASSPFSLHTRPYKTPIENAMRYRNRGDEPRQPARLYEPSRPPGWIGGPIIHSQWTQNFVHTFTLCNLQCPYRHPYTHKYARAHYIFHRNNVYKLYVRNGSNYTV